MAATIALIICTEPGRLENQSVLLAQSIRAFGGQLKDVPIYSYHPRAGAGISEQTLAKFEALQVKHQQIELNTEFPNYYLANKPITCAYAENTLDAEFLVFVDSDQCIFQEPTEFLLPDGYSVGLRPEYGKGIGSSGEGDKQDSYWQTIYHLLDVKTERFVTTPIGERRIRAYWNAGLVVTRRSARIFNAWKQNFEKVMRLGIAPVQGNYMVEQSMLSATICALDASVYTLPIAYNYPLPLHDRVSPSFKLQHFDELVTMHHFNMFFFDDWQSQLDKIQTLDRNSDKYRWLCEQLSQQDLPARTWEYRYRLLSMKVKRRLKLLLSKTA
ncbi:MAG: hypothetical protein MUC48_15190 [Leptolyngbya sp. Prado105]|jgi:hypothetical protein|nr:hypothetical protein [Leptolyngbya sp. Prado105]